MKSDRSEFCGAMRVFSGGLGDRANSDDILQCELPHSLTNALLRARLSRASRLVLVACSLLAFSQPPVRDQGDSLSVYF